MDSLSEKVKNINNLCLRSLNTKTVMNPIQRVSFKIRIFFKNILFFIFFLFFIFWGFFLYTKWVSFFINFANKYNLWNFVITVVVLFGFFIFARLVYYLRNNMDYFHHDNNRLSSEISGYFSVYTASHNNIFAKFLVLPREIQVFNNQILKKIENNDYENFFEITNEILIFIENLSISKKKIEKYFQKDYNERLYMIILLEINLMEGIFTILFQNQIKNHDKVIAEISELQNKELEDFFEILELQKIRLEKQKHIFEKIVKKSL